MSNRVKPLPIILAGVLLLAAAAILLGSLFSSEFFPEYSPAHRGAQIAVAAGCVSCHGPALAGEIINPGVSSAPAGQIPGLFEERMGLDELRQWIVNGVSDVKKASESATQARSARLIQMPAYESRLERSDIEDLVSFLALGQYAHNVVAEETPDSERLARVNGCFACHGELGQGGVENPGALKGYIPGFFGNDFRALTRNGDPQDLREWIENGHSQFFWDQGFAGFYPGRYFTERQGIRMPAYKESLTGGEINQIAAFLTDLMNAGPLDGTALLAFRPIQARSQAPEKKTRPAPAEPVPAAGEDEFSTVRKIFETRCLECHGAEKQRSGYRIDTREDAFRGGEISGFKGIPAIRPGGSGESLMPGFLTAAQEDPLAEIYPMPPKSKPPLFPAQIQAIIHWIDAGAPWPDGFVLATETVSQDPEPETTAPVSASVPNEAPPPPPTTPAEEPAPPPESPEN